jgi:hypothetical protein
MVCRKEEHDGDEDLVDHRDRVADDAEDPRQSERRIRELPGRSSSEEHKPRRYRISVCVSKKRSQSLTSRATQSCFDAAHERLSSEMARTMIELKSGALPM